MCVSVVKTLLIEDEEEDLRRMRGFLGEAGVRGRGFAVTSAGSLSEALGRLETEGYDVILLDLFLPDSAGLATFSAVSSRAPDTPVIPVTALEDEAAAVEAVRLGAQDYLLKKAVNAELLSRAIAYSMERKRISAGLRASEEHYRSLIDSLDDAILVLNPELGVIISNSAFKKAFRAGEPAGTDAAGGIPEPGFALPPKCLELCGRAISERKILTAEEPWLWSGAQSFLEVKCIPVPVGDKPRSVIIAAKNITARKQAEQLKDSFASMVSHELRMPLTAVLAGIAMVLESGSAGLDPSAKKLLSIAHDEARRMDRIIAKILEMSRLEAGCSRFKRTLADVAKLAEEAVSRFSQRAKDRNLELSGRYPAGGAETMLDADGITEVFTNLLSNALKFTGTGRIEVGVAENGDAIECYVKDSGIGISKEDQSRLFLKFKQFGEPVNGEDKGTGLGLFIVKEILRRHNGTLSVSSEPGKGTTFNFSLPKYREEKAAEIPGK